MRDSSKRIISILAAVTLLGATAFTAACGEKNYKGTKLDDYVSSQNAATDNGGFAVEKDGFVYFINGAESYTASNEYGKVVKGSLMRISVSDLNAGNYASVKTVVPMLIGSQNFESGIYIYGDYVYYATPTTDKNVSDGSIQNDWIDFKRAKLDGSEAMSGYYFRLDDNATNFRYVQENDTVYCLYEEDGDLKSYDTKSGKTTLLVSGAASDFYFDKEDLTSGTVYYTMNVTHNIDTDSSSTSEYTQLYKVSASASVSEAKADGDKAYYTVKDGKTYEFKKSYLDGTDGFSASDYTTYPYVNLGDLVLDGIGTTNVETQFNGGAATDASEPSGYTYTIQRVENDGVYFTRAAVVSTGSESAPVYYVADAASDESGWNTIKNNDGLTEVAESADVLSAAVILDGQSYIYLNDTTLCKVDGTTGEEIEMAYNLSSVTLWKTVGEYLYYYATGTNGNNLSRINYTGEKASYNVLLDEEEYKPATFAFVDWNSSWYKPEFIGNKVVYSGAQSFGGSTAYNYIYAADVSVDNVELKALNEKYEEVQDYIVDYSEDADVQAAFTYIFRNGESALTLLKEVEDLYDEIYVNDYTAFAKHTVSENEKTQTDYSDMFKDDAGVYYNVESYYIGFVGEMKSADVDAIAADWEGSLPSETEETEDESFPVWAIVLISVGGALVVAAAIVVPVLVIRKKKLAAAEREATVNAYKRKKIDTTDDKSIDVYTDETAEAPAEEAVEEAVVETEIPVEEPAAEPVEAPVEEAQEAPQEEAVEEENKTE